MALGEKLVYQVQPGEVSADEFLQLRARQEHEPTGRLKQYERGAFAEAAPIPQVGWDDQPAAVPHNDVVGPTHISRVPRRPFQWVTYHGGYLRGIGTRQDTGPR